MWCFPCAAGVRDRNTDTAKADTKSDAGVKLSNSFVTVEGRGIGLTEGGDIWYDTDSADSIRVTARSGWLVNGSESVTLTPSSGTVRRLSATSKLEEDDEHVHIFPCVKRDVHCRDIEISAVAYPTNQVAMYAVPDTGTVVSASASQKVVKKGQHYWTSRLLPCSICGAPPPEPSFEDGYYEVVPERYEWIATGAGQTLGSSTWTGMMTKGEGQEIKFDVTGKRDACSQCTCHAAAIATADVYELSIERPDYLGLDMTDAMKGKYVKRDATAHIDPAPAKSTNQWLNCGRCKFIGKTDGARVTYGGNDKTGGSESYLKEPLTVLATAWNAEGQSASATCTTNFTVVKVDVKLDGVGESSEEKTPPDVYYIADKDDGSLSKSGFRYLKPVSVACIPKDLPYGEVVGVAIQTGAKLYEITGTNEAVLAKSSYPCDEVGNVKFGIHGHSLHVTKPLMAACHAPSEARDYGRVKVVEPPPLEISVDFISPSGKWPYDPVWDDPKFEKTVDGSKAKECAENNDESMVVYSLSRDAKDVNVYFYKSEAFVDSLIVMTGGIEDTEGVHTNLLQLAEYLDVGAYYVKVDARDIERDKKCEAFDDGSLVRCDYYTAPDAKPSMNCAEIGKVTAFEEKYDTALRKLTLFLAVSGGSAVLAKAAAVCGFIEAAGVVKWVAGGALGGGAIGWFFDLFTDIGTAPSWLKAGISICDCSWTVYHWKWDRDSLTYVLYEGNTMTTPAPACVTVTTHGTFVIGYLAYAFEGDLNVGTAAVYLNEGFYCNEIESSASPNQGYLLSGWKWEQKPYGLIEPEINKPENLCGDKE